MTYDTTSFFQGVLVGWRLGRWHVGPKMTVIWLNGDGSELDRKVYRQGELEPITNKVPTKANEGNDHFIFSGWNEGETQGNVKTYTPTFVAESPYLLFSSPKDFTIRVPDVKDELFWRKIAGIF